MKVHEVFVIYDAKVADDYSEDELFRLSTRVKQLEADGTLNEQAAAESVIGAEIKDKSLVPSHEEGVKLIKTLLRFKKTFK